MLVERFPVAAVGSGEVKTLLDLLCFCNGICHKMQRDLLRLGLIGIRAAVFCVWFLTVLGILTVMTHV